MLKRRLLLASALVGVELLAAAGGAEAGGSLAGVRGSHSINLGSVNCRNIGGGSRLAGLNVYSPVNINNRVNSSTNVNVNKSLNVYSPVNVTNNIDNSTNITSNVNINNSKNIDNSTNVSVNKEINVSTTNIFNGWSSSHGQGGSWGSHSGGMGWGMGGGSSSNNNNNNNGNQNSNGNSNSNTNGSGNTNNNTLNNSNSINSAATVSAFLNGLRGLE